MFYENIFENFFLQAEDSDSIKIKPKNFQQNKIWGKFWEKNLETKNYAQKLS